MNTGLDQYMDIFKDAVEDSAAKLTKSFEKILIEVIILFMVIPRKINFTQMGRYGSHVEQTYRNAFGLKKSKSIDWLKLNVSLAKRFFGKQGRWAIAIDPSYISKAGKKKLFFSTDTSLSGEEVLLYYRTRFQIEFCFRDAKGYTGLMDCQARDKWKLDFAFNASFTSLNVAKVTMKEMGMEYSMSSFKSLMTNIYLVKRIFKASGYTPNRTLISKIFKDLSCLQRIAA